MENTLRLYDTLIQVLSQHRNWLDVRLSWPKKPSAQGSAGQPEQPKGVIYPERRVFERMCIFGQHR